MRTRSAINVDAKSGATRSSASSFECLEGDLPKTRTLLVAAATLKHGTGCTKVCHGRRANSHGKLLA